MSEFQSIEEVLAELDRYISESTAVLEQGSYASLSSFEETVQKITAALTQVPISNAHHHTQQLNQVMVRLNDLQHLMIAHQNQIKKKVSGLNQNKQANQAYAQKQYKAG